MTNLQFKAGVVEECKRIKIESEANLMRAMQDAEQSANEYGQPKDRYDSYRAQLSTRREMMAQQLLHVQEELGLLDRIDLSRECAVAGFGAVVFTSMQVVFISVGLGKIKAPDSKMIYAISASVPFAMAIRGHKAGDIIEFNGRKLTIEQVY